MVFGTWTTAIRPADVLLQAVGGIGRVVAADRDQTGHVEAQQGEHRVFEVLWVVGGIGPGDPDEGPAAEMDPADGLDGQRDHVLDVAAHDPLEAVPDPEDLDTLEDGADRRGPDHAVDAGGGTASDQDRQLLAVTFLHGCLTRRERPRAAL